MPVVAGVDTSTQSCTVDLRDADTGALLGRGRAPHPATRPPVSEHDPRDWWQALVAAFSGATAAAGVRGDEVAAVSVAGQCHGMVVLDDRGAVVRPAKLWNDTTSAPQSAAMVAELGRQEWTRAVGSVPIPAFTITKLAWLAEHEPGNLTRARTVLLPHDYLTWRLTGRRATDRSEASGTGYYAAHEGRYRVDLLERFVSDGPDWAAALPDVLGPEETAGEVTAEAASALGLSAGTPVAAGAGDQHAGAVGLGAGLADVVYSLGTSGVVLTESDTPAHDLTGWVTGVASAAGGYLPLVCTLNATKVTDMAARLLAVDHAALAALALAAPEDPSRPVLAAFLDGERTPDRPYARGLLAGLDPDLTREEFALAAFEGVLLGLVEGHDAIRRAGPAADGRVLVTGGGARSEAYRQLLADLLDTPVLTLDADEATARGAAVQAAAVLAGTTVSAVRDAWRPAVTGTTEPRRRDRAAAAAVRGRYRTLTGWTGMDGTPGTS